MSKIDVVLATFEAFDAEDFDAIAEMAHPDVELNDGPEAADAPV